MDNAEKRPRGRPRKERLSNEEPSFTRSRGRPRKDDMRLDTSISGLQKANQKIDKALQDAAEGKGKSGKVKVTKEEVQKIMLETIEAKSHPKVQSLEELETRLNQYFVRCAKIGSPPVIEEMYGYTGFSKYAIDNWLNGVRTPPFGEATKEVLRNASDYVKIYDAKAVTLGKLDFLTYCFRAKALYGMVEKQEVQVTVNNPMGDATTQKELEEHYLKSYYTVLDEKDNKKEPG